MSFKKMDSVLSSAVATNGTFAITYPTGVTAGSFANAWAHKLWVASHQKLYAAPADFTVSFGATSATITWLASTSIPAGGRVSFQADVYGADTNQPGLARVNSQVQRTQVQVFDLGAPITADADGVAASQTVTGAGTAFVLNGALVINGVAYFDTPRNVVGAWTNTAILTITGKDVDGATVVEKSASGTSHTGKKAFKSVSSVTTSATVTSATVGTGTVIGLPSFLPDASYVVAELIDGVAMPRPAGKVFLPFEIEETQLLAGTAEQLVSPVAGYISKLRTTVQKAVTTGGPITVEINGSAVTGLTVSVADGATVGTRASDAPTTRHGSDSLLAAGDKITVTPDTLFATAGEVNGVIEIDTTAIGQLDGTFVAGVTSTATATTGDVRGTYAPAITPDGTHGYQLVVVMPDPANRGVPQYTG